MMHDWLREMEILGIRHGFSAGQREPAQYLLIGDSKIPLDIAGRVQARDCGLALHAHFQNNPPVSGVAVLSSPYQRAKETFRIYRARVQSAVLGPISYPDYLGEHRYGAVNGLLPHQVSMQHADFLRARAEATQRGTRHLLPYPGVDSEGVPGESQTDVVHRTAAIHDDLRRLYDAGIRHVIVNAHGTSIRAVQMNLLGIESTDDNWRNWATPQNCQIDRIFNGERRTIYAGSPEPDHPAGGLPAPLFTAGNGSR